MNNSLKKRMFSLFLAMVMVISLVPVTAFAADDEDVPETSEIMLTDETTGGETEETIGDETEETIGGETEETVSDETEETVGEETEETVGEETEETVGEETEETVGEETEETVGGETEETVSDETEETTGEETAEETTGDAMMLASEEEEESGVIYEDGKFGYNGYYNVISRKDYVLVPDAAIEYEMVLNNDAGDRRQVIHVIEVDPSNPDVSIVPGYYQIDKLAENPDDETYWSHKELTEMAKYYEENLGYNIVGGMNTDLYYDTYAPRILVYNGQDLSVKGETAPSSSILYVFKDAEGNVSCDVRAFSRTEFDSYLDDGTLLHAVSVSFNMVVKDGQLVKTEERTSAAAARSMVGVKADGTLVICMNDGRGANNSIGFCDFEEGEAMLALGCQWAANCDGGGSSTFLTKRAGEDAFTMRSVPCDGAQRPTAHGIFVASNVGPTGVLDVVNIESDYDIFAPKTEYTFGAKAIDTNGYAMDIPEDASWALSDTSFGTIENGKFTSSGTKGTVDIQVLSGDQVVGTKTITVADPEVFELSADSTVIPYSTAEKIRTITLPIVAMTGEANVYVDTNAVIVTLSDENAGTLDGFQFTATDDTSVASAEVTITYDTTVLTYTITFGKGSEILWNFENNNLHGFLGQQDAYDWQAAQGIEAPMASIITAGNASFDVHSKAFIATEENGGQVHNGESALGIEFDMRYTNINSWSYANIYNVSNTDGSGVLRDVANDKLATTLGMWVYIPEGFYTSKNSGAMAIRGDFVAGTSAETAVRTNFNATYNGKTINSLTEADIPENRWIYAIFKLDGYNYVSINNALSTDNYSPCFARMYVKHHQAQKLTYYFDDFTLDYSSAVDDRNPPVISEATYCTADTNIAFSDATITSSVISFNAKVADFAASNAEGLDYSTGAIYIDGIKRSGVSAASGNLSVENVKLNNGEHTVTFEIADLLGNATTLTKEFVVEDASAKSTITLSGHNDSNADALAGSIYYLDLKASDITAIQSAVTTVELHTSNTWELEGMTTAPGFEVTYTVNPSESEFVTFTITKTGDCSLTGEQTILSIPVRIWNWDPTWICDSTGGTMTFEQRYADSAEPVVTVEADTCYGSITYADGTAGSFSDSFSCETAMKGAGINAFTLHIHDDELTVLNQEATTEAAGYENRTYCETCQSVVDWGTILDKVVVTHNYAIVDAQFVCQDEGCGEVYASGTGIFEMNGDLYYSINNVLKTGWQDAGDGLYCYAGSDYKLYIGEKTINGITYLFAEDGSTEGAWETNTKGTRYWYGPGYYSRMWVTFDDGANYYYFGRDSYMYTGINFVKDNPDTPPYWYDFGEDGLVEAVDGQKVRWDYVGLYSLGEDLYYVADGRSQGGLQYIDGAFYYFDSGTYIAKKSCTYAISVTNDLCFEDGTPVSAGSYTFDEDGKMIILNGLIDGYYYVNGTKKPYAGLIKYEGSFYYINDGAMPIAGRSYYITKTNDLTFSDGTLIPKGTYEFGEDGKMKIKEGLMDGVYYENGIKVPYAGLIKQDGYYYYINDYAKPVAGKTYYITKTNDLTWPDGTAIQKGSYEFDAEGRMVVKNGLVDGIYYVNSVKVPYAGLIKQDGYYYYINDNAKPVADKTYYITRLNDLTYEDGTAIQKGSYYFDEEGRMQIYNGLVDGVYYVNNVKVPYAGLIKQDGYYYYINDNAKPVANRSYYITRTNGLTWADGTAIQKGTYTFDADGKMIIE